MITVVSYRAPGRSKVYHVRFRNRKLIRPIVDLLMQRGFRDISIEDDENGDKVSMTQNKGGTQEVNELIAELIDKSSK